MPRLASAPKLWRESEDDFLRNYYEHLPVSEIAIQLNRTSSSIYQRGMFLELSRSSKRPTPIVEGGTVHVSLTGKHGVGKYAKADLEFLGELSKSSWHVSPDGYARANITFSKGVKEQTKMHHLILPLRGDGLEVDHINRDKLDNRRENLRYVTRRENILNSDNPVAKLWRGEPTVLFGRAVSSEQTKPYYMIWWCNTNKKWRAYVETKAKRIYVGSDHSRGKLEALCVERLSEIKRLAAS